MPTNQVDLPLIRPYLQTVAPRGRTMLLPALHHAQEFYGWLPRDVQEEISRILRVPLAEIHGVIEFYSMLYNQPTAKRVIRVCEDPVCALFGAEEVIHYLEAVLDWNLGEPSDKQSITMEKVPCLGMCEWAPVALDSTRPAGELNAGIMDQFLGRNLPLPCAKVYGSPRWITRRIGKVDPDSLADYLAHGGYDALKSGINRSPEALIDTIQESGILGRGGAMFPLGQKWRFTRSSPGSPGDKHIIVNADESEPGTFKDRCLMEEDPFSVIEAATLAAYAVGAENGWIFVRGEYPRSYQRLSAAVQQAQEVGLLGENILDKEGFNFNIEVRLGAGAYICGEETALFEAIEGKRGFPRIKPPFPTTHGLFNQPTAINNVETLVAALVVVEMGVAGWRNVGSLKSPGTKLFCLSGHINQPGLYEIPFGHTIRELIEMAGGVPKDRKIQAVLTGGAAGVFLGPDEIDVPLTYENSQANQFPIGSGVIMVFDQTVDLRQVMYQLGRFFAHESCGKCFPCQLGTQRQMEILERISTRNATLSDRQALEDIGFAMTKTSLCGLGQTAATAVLSAMNRWPELLQ